MAPFLCLKTENGPLAKHKEMTPDDVRRLLHVKETRAYVIMKQLSNAGLVEIIGRGKDKKYTYNTSGYMLN